MGIYSRDYFRDNNSTWVSWGLYGLTPVVKYLIIANVAMFLLQIFIVREVHRSPLEMLRKYDPDVDELLKGTEDNEKEAMDRLKKERPDRYKIMIDQKRFRAYLPAERISIVQEWCELDPSKVIHEGQVWRLLTHAFCHDRHGIFHIFLNMLGLFWFGCTLETMYGGREFLLFYLTAALVAALAYIGLDLYTGDTTPAVGASGAVMGVMMLYTMHYPYETIRIFWFFPLEMRWVMALYVIWDLHPVLLALAGDRTFSGIAHAAHLGGLAFGFLYGHYQWRLESLASWVPAWRLKLKRRPRLRIAPETVPVRQGDADMDRVDQLLQKILESGQASLTEEERAALQEASQRIKNRSPR
jgi:membrane associated rhomboid family serine protease